MVRTIRVKGLSEYLEQVDGLFNAWQYQPGAIWFRGLKDGAKALVPGVVWRKILDEQSLVDDFLVSYASLHGGPVENHWELYALMQHYGLPTRLLDWSKSPLVALYFAVEKAETAGSTSVVWAMDAPALNRILHQSDGIPVPGRRQNRERINVDAYLPAVLKDQEASDLPAVPLAIETPMTNRRILAQQGCFTVHGKGQEPIDQIFRKAKSDRLVRFEIRGSKWKQQILDSLRNAGWREESIYQDLPSLTQRIIREWTP